MITLDPIGFVRSPYTDTAAIPKGPGAQHDAEGVLEIRPDLEPGLADIEGFSHLIVLWIFDRAKGADLVAYPPSDDRPHGVFATRSPQRPNPIGLTVVRLLGRDGRRLRVHGIDMLDGTPIVDIKPYLSSIPADQIRRGWLDEAEARRRQVDVWNRMSHSYEEQIDRRFAPVVAGVLGRAALSPGERVLDLGTGTGSVAIGAATAVGEDGHVTAVDISEPMLARAAQRARVLGRRNITFQAGSAEHILSDASSYDVVLASLSLMYVIDRQRVARETARVLRPGGRFVAAVWGAPDACDIVHFQQFAGSFAPAAATPGVGPGALADPAPFVRELAVAGIDARVDTEVVVFDFDSFESAWDALAGVTAAALTSERREEAKKAVRTAMWPKGDGPREFHNLTQFIVGRLSED